MVDADSGEVLHAAAADTQKFPASLTKMMTLHVVFDEMAKGRLRLDQKLTVSKRAAGQAPSRLGLRAGQTITVEDAILALVTKSANDAAVVVAEAIAKTETKFAQRMTERARQLGMGKSTFRNASGLPNRYQLSTARDMATLARSLLTTHANYYHYFSTRQFTYAGSTHTNHNRLMQAYEGADGIKTGYINASGFNLVASARRDGRRLVGVVFGGKTAGSRDAHMAKLLDAAFAGKGSADEVRVAQAEAEAPTVATAAPADEGLSGSGDAEETNWGIQVGAFRTQKPARTAAEDATRRLGALVEGGTIAVSPLTTKKGKTLYRSRILGITEDQARSACGRMAKVKLSCQVVAPGELSLASARR